MWGSGSRAKSWLLGSSSLLMVRQLSRSVPAKTSTQTVCEPDVLRLTAESGFGSSSFGKAAVHVPLFEGT